MKVPICCGCATGEGGCSACARLLQLIRSLLRPGDPLPSRVPKVAAADWFAGWPAFVRLQLLSRARVDIPVVHRRAVIDRGHGDVKQIRESKTHAALSAAAVQARGIRHADQPLVVLPRRPQRHLEPEVWDRIAAGELMQPAAGPELLRPGE